MGLLGDYTLRWDSSLGPRPEIPPAAAADAAEPAPANDAPATSDSSDGMSAGDGFAIAKAGVQAADALYELFGPQENPKDQGSGSNVNPSGPSPIVQGMFRRMGYG